MESAEATEERAMGPYSSLGELGRVVRCVMRQQDPRTLQLSHRVRSIDQVRPPAVRNHSEGPTAKEQLNCYRNNLIVKEHVRCGKVCAQRQARVGGLCCN